MAYIITENCTGCTACMKRCPTDAITGERKLLHVIDPELCIDCGACGVVCPDEAIYDHQGNLCDMLKPAARPRAYVDLQSCVGCEWCVWACPFDALVMVDLKSSHHFPVSEVITKKCVGCTLCELDCPYDAIHIFRGDSLQASAQEERNARYEEETGARPAAPPADPDAEEKSSLTQVMTRPAFAKDFPEDPRLDRLVTLFEQGNYAEVRKDARELIRAAKDAEIRAAAEQLLKRLEPDPLALYLLGLAAALLVVLAGWYWTHPREVAPSPPPPTPNPAST